MVEKTSLDEKCARDLDIHDSLASFRQRFYIPAGIIYLDGNSLGLMSKDAEIELDRVQQEWRDLAIGGWLGGTPPWFYLPETLGAAAAELVGAEPAAVVCTGTTTVNLHALVSTFYQPEGSRRKILADVLNFPTDIYALRGQVLIKGLNPDDSLVLAPSADGVTLDETSLMELMTDEVAVVLLPSVLYRSGQLLDIPSLIHHAHKRGIIIGFDCSHSVGAVPHRFDEWGLDFAVWCSYKYLNGGPGSPAFLYVNRRHFHREPILAGWFGYEKQRQFEMNLEFHHARCAGGWQISTTSILSTAALAGALKITLEAGIEAIRDKSLRLTSYLIQLLDHYLPSTRYPVRVVTPREPQRRSGHVAVGMGADAWAIYQALKGNGIVPDFRPPDIIRFAPTALYNTFHEAWRTVQTLKRILDERTYETFSKNDSVERGGDSGGIRL